MKDDQVLDVYEENAENGVCSISCFHKIISTLIITEAIFSHDGII